MVTTERMCIYPISDEELQRKIQDEPDSDMKKAYSEMLEGCIRVPEQRIWHTVWLMEIKGGEVVGDLSFKGLNQNGSVEIGYGIKPQYAGKGLMTEAVTAMAKWAAAQPGVLQVEAEAEAKNIASQRVLEKSGFAENGIMGKEGPRFLWKNS